MANLAAERKRADPPKMDPPLDYSAVAWWAEAADGLRDQPLTLALKELEGKITPVLETEAEADANGHQKLLTGIEIKSVQKDRVKVTKTQIQVRNTMKTAEIDKLPCDAVFCSESAIQKFVFPYYHSQRLLDDNEWEILRAALNDPQVPAIGHVAPSRARAIGQDETLIILRPEKDNREDTLKWWTLEEYNKTFIL